MHADTTAVTIQSNKIVSNKETTKRYLTGKKKMNEFFGLPTYIFF